LKVFGIGAIVVYVVWTGVCLFNLKNFEIKSAGEFGDTFGVLNAFFSGAAFLGFLYALSLQLDELMIQGQNYEKAERRERMRAQPYFYCTGYEPLRSGQLMGLTLKFLNYGGIVTITECRTSDSARYSVNVNGSPVVAGGQSKEKGKCDVLVNIAFDGTPEEIQKFVEWTEFEFSIHCRDAFGEYWTQSFRREESSSSVLAVGWAEFIKREVKG